MVSSESFSTHSELSERSEKIKNRKPTGKKVKKKCQEELEMINRNYQMDSISVNMCQAPKDYENVTTITGNENEFPQKTSKVIFHSSVNSLCLDSVEADKKAGDQGFLLRISEPLPAQSG